MGLADVPIEPGSFVRTPGMENFEFLLVPLLSQSNQGSLNIMVDIAVHALGEKNIRNIPIRMLMVHERSFLAQQSGFS
jgi:hypothetical protein